MLDLINPGNFEFLARYFLAGFLILSIRSLFARGERPKPAETLFESVVMSLVNQMIFLLAVTALSAESWASGSTTRVPFFLEVLVLPLVLGATWGAGLQSRWAQGFVRLLNLPTVHARRRAYNFAFREHETESFVIVTYTDGMKVFGFYGGQSLASNDANRSDLYLESIYTVDQAGKWHLAVPERSALIY